MKKRNICVVTGSRSEYGVLSGLLKELNCDHKVALDLIVTGEHLVGSKIQQLERQLDSDNLVISKRVEMLLATDSAVGINKSIGLGIIGITDALVDLKPELVVLSGDRFEMFAAAIAASGLSIPVAHLFGGEITEGALDEVYRHSITKMAHLHFVATERYQKRVIQLGESPERVFNFGSISVDGISSALILEKPVLEKDLSYSFGELNLLATFHPETLGDSLPARQVEPLLAALDERPEIGIIFTYPNADSGREAIIQDIRNFVKSRNNAVFIENLGQERYFSCVHHCDGVIGNSSSGISEIPSFNKGTVNIGDRQGGRERAASVIDCVLEKGAILSAIDKLLSKSFQQKLKNAKNPYEKFGATKRVAWVLANHCLENVLKKKFFDT